MDHWMNFSVGSSACHIAVSQIQKRNELDVELYISEGSFLPLFTHLFPLSRNINRHESNIHGGFSCFMLFSALSEAHLIEGRNPITVN